MPASENEHDLALIRDAAREAGEIAMRHFRRDPQVWMKNGSSPVSAADLAVDAFLRATLLAARLNALAVANDRGWQAAGHGRDITVKRVRRGVTRDYRFDADFLGAAECRRLDAMAAALQESWDKPAQLIHKDKSYTLGGPIALIDQIMELGRAGADIGRYKGLGEMNPEQLWETTLDPTNRSLLQVKVQHIDEAEQIFATLMGDVVEPRRDFIQENALNATNIDA